MKVLLSCLVSFLIFGNLVYGFDESTSSCDLKRIEKNELEAIISKNVGQQLLHKLSYHLSQHGVGVLSETLNIEVKAIITNLVLWYDLSGSVKTNTNQELHFSAKYKDINGIAIADTWNPDGSGVNARCQIVHLPSRAFTIYNGTTSKIILEISPEEIKPFDAYKM